MRVQKDEIPLIWFSCEDTLTADKIIVPVWKEFHVSDHVSSFLKTTLV